MSITIKYVVLWEQPAQPPEWVWVSPPPRKGNPHGGTPWGPPDSGVEWDGWAILAVRAEREEAMKIAQKIRRGGSRVRLERWVYEPGQQRARCFVEKIVK